MSPIAFADGLTRFDIDKQRADKAIIAFAKKTDQTVIFSFDLTKKHQEKCTKRLLFSHIGPKKITKRFGFNRCC